MAELRDIAFDLLTGHAFVPTAYDTAALGKLRNAHSSGDRHNQATDLDVAVARSPRPPTDPGPQMNCGYCRRIGRCESVPKRLLRRTQTFCSMPTAW